MFLSFSVLSRNPPKEIWNLIAARSNVLELANLNATNRCLQKLTNPLIKRENGEWQPIVLEYMAEELSRINALLEKVVKKFEKKRSLNTSPLYQQMLQPKIDWAFLRHLNKPLIEELCSLAEIENLSNRMSSFNIYAEGKYDAFTPCDAFKTIAKGSVFFFILFYGLKLYEFGIKTHNQYYTKLGFAIGCGVLILGFFFIGYNQYQNSYVVDGKNKEIIQELELLIGAKFSEKFPKLLSQIKPLSGEDAKHHQSEHKGDEKGQASSAEVSSAKRLLGKWTYLLAQVKKPEEFKKSHKLLQWLAPYLETQTRVQIKVETPSAPLRKLKNS